MTRIPIVTQNFLSPNVQGDTPLMLLPQAPTTSSSLLSDKDQNGFNQLLLHDLHRHRLSYVRSYTAYETLKKRHDFVLRQENLRSIQRFEHRLATKQDQYLDQSMHAYEQCFVKVVNGTSQTSHTPTTTTTTTTSAQQQHHQQQQQQRPRTAAPSFDKFHTHQLSHIPATPLEPPTIIPFHRYKKNPRLLLRPPPPPPKYRADSATVYRTAQSLHDAFQSASLYSGNAFHSFTESYLQKYGDKSQIQFKTNSKFETSDMTKEDELVRPSSALTNHSIDQIKQANTAANINRIRSTISSRNTNTPSSTPRLSFNDGIHDGLTLAKDIDENNVSPTVVVHDERRSSQQSTSGMSSSGKNIKRPKTGKKKRVLVVNLTSKTKTTDGDLLKQAIVVQNYGTESNLRPKVDSLVPSDNTDKQLKRTSSLHHRRRSSVGSNDNETKMSTRRQTFDNDGNPIGIEIRRKDSLKESPPPIESNDQEKIISVDVNVGGESEEPTTSNQETKETIFQSVDLRKRIRKGAFEPSENMGDMIAFELSMKKTRVRTMTSGKENRRMENGNGDNSEHQANMDLLEKIRQSACGVSIGQMALSQQGCRFELPFDLKILESLTPLDYLSKYCRLSSRRNYQFKRIFEKYRNNQYRFDSSNLYSAIVDIHTDSFTRTQFDSLCHLIDLDNQQQQQQFTFDTFAGIIALCERILYGLATIRNGYDDYDLAKDILEKCDFDSLDRKFDGLAINEPMRRLLKTL